MRGRLILGLAGLVALTACDGLFGPEDRPPAGIDRAPLASSATVASSVEARVTVSDKDGKPLKGADVSWAPQGGGSVSPATSSTDGEGVARTTWTLGTAAGQQTLTARTGDLETTFSVTAEAGALDQLAVTPDGGAMASLGDTLLLAAAGADAYGNAVSLRDIQWRSSAPSIAEVTPAGAVVSHAEGEAQITASLDGVSTTVTVTVDQVVTAVAIDLWTTTLARSESFQLRAEAVDARGAPVDTALSVSWSSSAPGVAAIDASGRLDAVGVGEAVISASAPPFSGELTVTVKAGPRPTISGISPAVLQAGVTATISGTGFSTAGQNQVTVAGVPATVTAATATALTVTMPPPGSFPCGPTGTRAVEVTANELTVATQHPLAGATQRRLAIGEAAVLDGGNLGCNEIVAPGSYVMTVFNTSPVAGSNTAFQVRGSGGGTAAAPVAAAYGYTPTIRVAPSASPARPVDPEVRAHLRMLDRNLELLRRLGPPPRRAASSAGQSRLRAVPAVGDLRTFRIPDLDGTNICSDYSTVTARVVYAGQKGIIYEDTLAPLARTMDAKWQEVGQEFDNVMYPVLTRYFGDPLVYDDQLDGDGRFNMLFSKFVNDMEAGVAGFVFSGDFFPRAGAGGSCASSDEGEIFYGRVPTASGSGYNGYTADSWAWGMRSTVIHEVKHITSYAHKFRDAGSGQPNYEEQWLEESTARLAEEFYARALFGYGQRQNVTYQQSIYGEVRVGENWPQYDGFPNIMQKHFGGVYDYFDSIEELSPIGKVGEDWSYYGSGWLFVRWAIDQSGGDEAAFVRALIDEDGVSGVANIERRTGRSFRELLGDFTLALATDDHPGGFTAADAGHTHPGWDTRDIFTGLNDDFPDSYTSAWPLQSRTLPAGAFQATVPTLRGGSTTVFELSVAAGQTQLLRVLGTSGGAAPSPLGMAIIRVQ